MANGGCDIEQCIVPEGTPAGERRNPLRMGAADGGRVPERAGHEVREHPGGATLGAEREEVKQIRAQGGCLGIRSRRKTRQAAKSCGEEQMSIDPQVSEWGDPAEHTSATPCRTHRHGGGNPAN